MVWRVPLHRKTVHCHADSSEDQDQAVAQLSLPHGQLKLQCRRPGRVGFTAADSGCRKPGPSSRSLPRRRSESNLLMADGMRSCRWASRDWAWAPCRMFSVHHRSGCRPGLAGHAVPAAAAQIRLQRLPVKAPFTAIGGSKCREQLDNPQLRSCRMTAQKLLIFPRGMGRPFLPHAAQNTGDHSDPAGVHCRRQLQKRASHLRLTFTAA